jgi:hypothetical protein
LVKEHSVDIRYIAPWKKWVVWEDTHWQVDTGALLYTKQLEMVQNIYAEFYKTADYRERWKIENMPFVISLVMVFYIENLCLVFIFLLCSRKRRNITIQP